MHGIGLYVFVHIWQCVLFIRPTFNCVLLESVLFKSQRLSEFLEATDMLHVFKGEL